PSSRHLSTVHPYFRFSPTRRSSDLYSDYAYFYDALYGSAGYLYDNAGDQISPNQYIRGIDRYRRNFFEARVAPPADARIRFSGRSEEHTSELQSREKLVCRLLREKK